MKMGIQSAICLKVRVELLGIVDYWIAGMTKQKSGIYKFQILKIKITLRRRVRIFV